MQFYFWAGLAIIEVVLPISRAKAALRDFSLDQKPNTLYYTPRKIIADVFCFERCELEQHRLTVDNLKLLGLKKHNFSCSSGENLSVQGHNF